MNYFMLILRAVFITVFASADYRKCEKKNG